LAPITFMISRISYCDVRGPVSADAGVEDGVRPFVRMHMSGYHQIDVILVQDFFNVILEVSYKR
jgi:hypothetical protein